MNEQITILVAGTADAPELTTLGITTFRDAFAKDNKKEDMDKYVAEEMNLAKITAEIQDTNNVFFLVKYEDVLVGYAKMRATQKPPELKDNDPIEIERIYVLQDYHNIKIGAALMKHCVDYAISRRHDVLWLGVWEHNYKAVSFYNRWGFKLFGSHEFKLGDDIQTDVLMMKYL